jgi:CBS domain-containing protein
MAEPDSPPTATGRTVSDVMFDPAAVIEHAAHLAAAAYLMRHLHTPGLIVVDDEGSRRPVGSITAFDIVRAVSHASDPSEATVAEWQSAKPTSVHPETPLRDALDLMLDDAPQPHLPVVDGRGNLVGVVDLIHIARVARGLL